MESSQISTWFALAWVVTSATGCNPDLLVPNFADANSATLPYDDSAAELRLVLATVTMEVSEEPADNLASIEEITGDLLDESPEVELVLFGETTLGWYYVRDDAEEYQRSVAEAIPGPATERLAALADAEDIYLAFGLAEVDGGDLYNSLVVLDPDGEIAAVARKNALILWDEDSGYLPGTEIVSFELGELQVGLAICNDASHQPLAEELADRGVDLILHAWATNYGYGSDVTPFARMTGAWVVASNRVGTEGDLRYNGDIFVADPAGTRRVEHRDSAGHLVYDLGVVR